MSDFDSRARKAADSVRQQIADNPHNTEKGIRRAAESIDCGAARATLAAMVRGSRAVIGV